MELVLFPVKIFHVLIAVLGVGSIGGLLVLSRAARRNSLGSDVAWLRPLVRTFGISLGLMLVTGVLMDFLADGAYHERWWFRGSVLLLVATGALNGFAQRALRGGSDGLRRFERLGYGMCALVAAITVLMAARPF